MIGIHAIDGKKAILRLSVTGILVIMLWVVYRMTVFHRASMEVKDITSKEVNLITVEGDIDVYKQTLQQTIPQIGASEAVEKQTASTMAKRIFKALTDIDIENALTLVGKAIPLVEYYHIPSSADSNTIIEVGLMDQFGNESQTEIEIARNIYQEMQDEFYYEPEEQKPMIPIANLDMEQLSNLNYLQQHLYTIDQNAYVTIQDLPMNKLLKQDVRINLESKGPKILIFHTHSQEDFVDSVSKDAKDRIVGVGQTLGEILAYQYGISVVHDIGEYDVSNGALVRDGSYERMEPAVRKILEKYPSIEVCIDLHRDGLPDHLRLTTEIDGKPTAKIMFVNGISRLNNRGTPKQLDYLYNPYIQDNLAFSTQMQLKANELYPDFARKIYIKPHRFSLHMMPKTLLVEAGANTNTLEEVMNAMEPLARILVEVLKGDQS